MAIKTLRVFQEFTSEGYVPMPPAGNIDYGYTIAGTFPGTTPATFQTDDPDLDVTVTEMTDFYVWIRSHGAEWNINYTRNVRVYPDSPLINNVIMGIIIANYENALPVGGTTGQILAKIDDTDYNAQWIDNYADWTSQLKHQVKAGVALTKGQAVYVSSADGTNMVVSKASNSAESTSSKTLGLVAQNLALNGKGFVITEGLLSGLDTSSATIGDAVWLGTNGNLIYGLTNKPHAPAHLVFIGIVTRVNNNNGEIFIKVQNGFEIEELHNVLITSPSNNQGIVYDSSSSLWKNIAIQLPITLTTTGSSGASTFIGNALNVPTYTLVGLGGVPTTRALSINGTSFDLSADRSWNVGTVTSVNASVPTGFSISGNPITSSGTLAIAFAAGYSLPTDAKQSQWDTAYNKRIMTASLPLQIDSNNIYIYQSSPTSNGYLSSTDWTTFNTKQNALSGTGFVKVAGSTISYDNTAYTPTSRLITINGTSYDLSADRSWTITPGSGMRNVQSFTATSGQTTFTITGGYTVGLVDVYVNGARLSTSDYTASNGTSVVLGVGVVTNDIVDFVSYTASLSSGINGSGTTNYHAKFTASNVLGNSLIFDNGTNIGIGTATPSAVLHVVGTILSSSSVTATSFVKSGGTSAQILVADGSVITAGTNITISGGTISASGGGSITGSGTTNYLTKWTSSSAIGNSIIYDNGTNVGIGTSSSLTYKLNVNGEIFAWNLWTQESAWTIGTSSASASITGFGTTGYAGTTNTLIFNVNASERMRINSSGNIGIGTSSPVAKVDITGSDVNRVVLRVANTNVPNGDKEINMFVGGTSAYGISSWQNSGVIESVAGLSSNFVLSNYQTGAIIFTNSGRIERMRILADGKVAIGSSTTIFSSAFQVCQNTAGGVMAHFYDPAANSGFYWSAYSTSILFEARTSSGSTYRDMVFQVYGGNFGIRTGVSTLSYTLQVNGTVAGVGGYVNWSDARLKKDVKPLQDSLKNILNLNGISYNWDKKIDPTLNLDDDNHIGLLAQDVEKILPQVVSTAKDKFGTKAIAYSDLVPVLIEAIKELNAKIEAK
jgi:predicted heme/steroid binding protein